MHGPGGQGPTGSQGWRAEREGQGNGNTEGKRCGGKGQCGERRKLWQAFLKEQGLASGGEDSEVEGQDSGKPITGFGGKGRCGGRRKLWRAFMKEQGLASGGEDSEVEGQDSGKPKDKRCGGKGRCVVYLYSLDRV